MLKEEDEAWLDYFWRVADVVVLGAGFSTVVWCLIWGLGFVILTVVSHAKGIPTATTAFVLTLTVLLGHLPKFFAMFLGTDTDFQNFKTTFSKFTLRNVPWIRMSAAGALIYCLLTLLKDPAQVAKMLRPLDLTDPTEFVSQTSDFLVFCLLLVLVQFVFSFPKNVKRVKGRRLGSAR